MHHLIEAAIRLGAALRHEYKLKSTPVVFIPDRDEGLQLFIRLQSELRMLTYEPAGFHDGVPINSVQIAGIKFIWPDQ